MGDFWQDWERLRKDSTVQEGLVDAGLVDAVASSGTAARCRTVQALPEGSNNALLKGCNTTCPEAVAGRWANFEKV